MFQLELFPHPFEFHFYHPEGGKYDTHQFDARDSHEAIDKVVEFVREKRVKPCMLMNTERRQQVELLWERLSGK